jgi:Fe-S cluster assembly ATPase SufC
MNIFKINHLTTTFGKKDILSNVSLQAQEGDVVAILGPNGAGKSTLLKAIMHHFNVQVKTGTITFNRKNITE